MTGTASGMTHFSWESFVVSSHCFSSPSSFAPCTGCSGKLASNVKSSNVLHAQGRNSLPTFYKVISDFVTPTQPSCLPNSFTRPRMHLCTRIVSALALSYPITRGFKSNLISPQTCNWSYSDSSQKFLDVYFTVINPTQLSVSLCVGRYRLGGFKLMSSHPTST